MQPNYLCFFFLFFFLLFGCCYLSEILFVVLDVRKAGSADSDEIPHFVVSHLGLF